MHMIYTFPHPSENRVYPLVPRVKPNCSVDGGVVSHPHPVERSPLLRRASSSEPTAQDGLSPAILGILFVSLSVITRVHCASGSNANRAQ